SMRCPDPGAGASAASAAVPSAPLVIDSSAIVWCSLSSFVPCPAPGPAPQPTQGRGHIERGDRGLATLVLDRRRHPGAVQRLLLGVRRQDPVADRGRLIQGYAGEAGGDGVAYILEMRGAAPDHHPQ